MDNVKVGTCSVCGQELILTPDDCWHPWTIKDACPSGMRPGAGNFVEAPE